MPEEPEPTEEKQAKGGERPDAKTPPSTDPVDENDLVDEAGMESFPASDPPSFNDGRAS